MSDPAGEKDGWSCVGEVLRLKRHGGPMEEIARVVKRHDCHDETAESVDGSQARGCCLGRDGGGGERLTQLLCLFVRH
jgi:hypothetical protein